MGRQSQRKKDRQAESRRYKQRDRQIDRQQGWQEKDTRWKDTKQHRVTDRYSDTRSHKDTDIDYHANSQSAEKNNRLIEGDSELKEGRGREIRTVVI